jgi:hypothetical protein
MSISLKANTQYEHGILWSQYKNKQTKQTPWSESELVGEVIANFCG